MQAAYLAAFGHLSESSRDSADAVDFATAVRAMTRIGQVFLPEPEHARTYEQLYRRVYGRMYDRLQPLYRDIRAITGYPSTD